MLVGREEWNQQEVSCCINVIDSSHLYTCTGICTSIINLTWIGTQTQNLITVDFEYSTVIIFWYYY